VGWKGGEGNSFPICAQSIAGWAGDVSDPGRDPDMREGFQITLPKTVHHL
jgi:hypothetical protein